MCGIYLHSDELSLLTLNVGTFWNYILDSRDVSMVKFFMQPLQCWAEFLTPPPLLCSKHYFQHGINILFIIFRIRLKYCSLFHPEDLQVLNFLSLVLDQLIVDVM